MISGLTWQSYPPEKLLADRFHITNGFHPGQRDIIEQLVQGKRVLAIQRTGWGKSLCYQMASLYYPHLSIVFSPLKALMREQCQRCNDWYNIPSAIISSDFSEVENEATLEQTIAGTIKLLYIAPERLSNALWQVYAPKLRISMIVIDEAHCISTWGHDFRPHYRRIVRLLSTLPKSTPVLALTATANGRVEQDILQQIGTAAQIIRGTLQRPNLILNVIRLNGDQDKLGYLGEVLLQRPDTGIIYTATRSSAAIVATFLRRLGMNAEYYHAEREADVRQSIEQKFMTNQYNVVCSTTALGMGIDKPDVRFVIHYHIPASPINYYQEMGRAGRDGEMAWCILLYDAEDLIIQEHFIDTNKPEEKSYETVLSQLHRYPQGLQKEDIMWETGFSRDAVRTILADLEDQHFIKYTPRDQIYTAIERQSQIDFSANDAIRLQKQQELRDMQSYAQIEGCYMNYLTTYLGDEAQHSCGVCGHCQKDNFPFVMPSERIQTAAIHFLNEDFMPHIEKYNTGKHVVHEAGWSLSYHGKTSIGKLVRASKYDDAGPFALSLVYRAVEVIRARYPIHLINGMVSVPPTKSGLLVEMFAQQVAELLAIEYLSVLAKVRQTREQKDLTNRIQKSRNVTGAFSVRSSELVTGRTLLLIDDIYDSGSVMREVGQTLMQAGAKAVHPLTITRTLHSDNQ